MSPGPVLGGMQATEDSLRASVCARASDLLESWPADHEGQIAAVRAIWDEVIAHGAPSMYGKAWCGAFALMCLRQAGVADGVFWIPGIGFLEQHCWHTESPLPGDIAYFAEPFQHHAVVTAVSGDTFDSIDGNQPGILAHTGRALGHAMFYSIEPMLKKTLEAIT